MELKDIKVGMCVHVKAMHPMFFKYVDDIIEPRQPDLPNGWIVCGSGGSIYGYEPEELEPFDQTKFDVARMDQQERIESQKYPRWGQERLTYK